MLRKRNHIIISPEEGQLASLHTGKGRLAELNVIMNHIRKLFKKELILENKNILITAGPTQEPIDPVRFITNRSSGKMGYSIARAAKDFGGEVTLISGPVSIAKISGIKHIDIQSAEDMKNVISNELIEKKFDFIFMVAAIADYTPALYSSRKIKSDQDKISLELKQTIDITEKIISKSKAVKIGFSLETENGEKNALKKMKSKNTDYMILNYANEKGAGFDEDTNHIYIYSKSGGPVEFPKNTKLKLAKGIIQHIINNEK
jgi:phosphopantothenoylcysteine decarboxylase/phosphopantothenate--cysteine ligase